MTEASAPIRAGRPKSEAKAEAILGAAAELFLAQGFQGTSMDAVAKRAGVSKQTVYSHFANKEELFKACIGAKVAGYGFDSAAMVDDDDLRRLCQQLLDANPRVVADLQAGKMKAVGALIGQARKQNPNVNPNQVRETCLELVQGMN